MKINKYKIIKIARKLYHTTTTGFPVREGGRLWWNYRIPSFKPSLINVPFLINKKNHDLNLHQIT